MLAKANGQLVVVLSAMLAQTFANIVSFRALGTLVASKLLLLVFKQLDLLRAAFEFEQAFRRVLEMLLRPVRAFARLVGKRQVAFMAKLDGDVVEKLGMLGQRITAIEALDAFRALETGKAAAFHIDNFHHALAYFVLGTGQIFVHGGQVVGLLTSIHQDLVAEFAAGHRHVLVVGHLDVLAEAVGQFVLFVAIQALVKVILRPMLRQSVSRFKAHLAADDTSDAATDARSKLRLGRGWRRRLLHRLWRREGDVVDDDDVGDAVLVFHVILHGIGRLEDERAGLAKVGRVRAVKLFEMLTHRGGVLEHFEGAVGALDGVHGFDVLEDLIGRVEFLVGPAVLAGDFFLVLRRQFAGKRVDRALDGLQDVGVHDLLHQEALVAFGVGVHRRVVVVVLVRHVLVEFVLVLVAISALGAAQKLVADMSLFVMFIQPCN